MKIINKVNDESYIQWIEKFVTDVLKSARRKVKCEEVVIEDIEPSRNISLSLDGKEYVIRTWNFHQIGTDLNGNTCAENVEYTLYEMVEDEDGAHGNEVDFGLIRITWINEEDLKMRGTVKWFNNPKGYGFIVDENGEEIFVHYSGLDMEGFKYLEEGQIVEFDVMNVEKGRQAVNVSIVKEVRYQIVKVADFEKGEICVYFTFVDFEKTALKILEEKIQSDGVWRKWENGFYMLVRCEDCKYIALEGVIAFAPDNVEIMLDNLSETFTGTFDMYFKGKRMIG